MVALEAENSQLRIDYSLHRDLGRDLLVDPDTDVMTKAVIADCIRKPQQATVVNYSFKSNN